MPLVGIVMSLRREKKTSGGVAYGAKKEPNESF